MKKAEDKSFHLPTMRQRELKYFCRQYDTYAKYVNNRVYLSSIINSNPVCKNRGVTNDIFNAYAMRYQSYIEAIDRSLEGVLSISIGCGRIRDHVKTGKPIVSDLGANEREALDKFYWALDRYLFSMNI